MGRVTMRKSSQLQTYRQWLGAGNGNRGKGDKITSLGPDNGRKDKDDEENLREVTFRAAPVAEGSGDE